MKALYMVVLLALLTGTACERKEEVEPLADESACDEMVTTLAEAGELVIGRWQWVQTYTFLRGMSEPRVETPQTNGYTEEIQFTADGTAQFYRNGQPTETYQYEIHDVKGETTLFIQFTSANDLENVLLRLCPNTLVLNHSYNDSGGNRTYKKI